MVTLHWYNEQYSAEYAVRGKDSVTLYDDEYNQTFKIMDIAGHEWSYISLEGDWSPSTLIPTETDRIHADIDYLGMESTFHQVDIDMLTVQSDFLEAERQRSQADIDFLTMENEYLSSVTEQQQADIDFLLMISGEDEFEDEEQQEPGDPGDSELLNSEEVENA